ncbi:MAG: TolC family outer membrane protein [Alphaproteobacteria bacterium]|jgi:outer membrane protein|nr:TolC family outer membrane protein [Alphaproteobacteria bacterium]
MSMQHLKVFQFFALLISSTFLCSPSFGESIPLLQDIQIQTEEKAMSSGEQRNEEPASLQQTLEQIYMQNTDLDAARAGLRATDEDVSQANAEWRPSLSVVGSQEQTQRYPIGPGKRAHNSNTNYVAALNQNIYAGGKTTATIGQAESNVLAGRAGLFNQEQQTLLAGVNAHTLILANEAKVNYLEQSKQFYKKNLEHAEARFEVGEGSRTDVEASRAKYEEAIATLSAAIGDLESSRATYTQQVGNEPGNLSPAHLIIELPKNLERAIEIAKTHSPVILQARYALEAALYSVDIQIAGLLPTVDVRGTVGNSVQHGTPSGNATPLRPKNTDLGFLATVNVPLYSKGIPNSQIRQAYQIVAQQKVKLVGAQRQAVADVTSAWDNLIAARDSVKGFMAQVKAQELAVEGAVEEVNVGTKSIIDVLFLQEDLIAAQINLADAQQKLIVTSYQVFVAMGRLTARDLRLNVKYYDPDAYYNEYKNAWIQFWQGKDLRYVKDGDPQ